MKLIKVEIHKFKSFSEKQVFDVEDDTTILVGMNESGKTSTLEAIAKTNYFMPDDEDFKFNSTHDYPRREKKKFDKGLAPKEIITCWYALSDQEVNSIEKYIGVGVLNFKECSYISNFNEKDCWGGVSVDKQKFIDLKFELHAINDPELMDDLLLVKDQEAFDALMTKRADEDELVEKLKLLEPFFENSLGWDDPISEYVARRHLKTKLPKFLYYDEYYALPSRISIEQMNDGVLEENDQKTAKALFELADINTNELVNSDDFEDFIAELEATQSIISGELFKYWNTNKNLEISFHIDKRKENSANGSSNVVEHVLDIRVKNKGVSLPLKNRSKGFNWFFSFLVWFKKIQEDKDTDYILLLDEPGLNLHASAQADLLKFLEDLSEDYQIIYTTHSPFMISSDKLHRVRTVFETEKGSTITDSIQQKDPNTLFPLQAALGYDIAQNLFVTKNNLLVEGVSDLIYLTFMSNILKSENREHLAEDITIVPTGGLDKVASFISLLRGSELNIVCLLDSYTDKKGKAKLDNMVSGKIIQERNVHFFDEFLDGFDRADLEDLFSKAEYIKLFNGAFSDRKNIKISDLNKDIQPIIIQINKYLGKDRFNHYLPANYLAQLAPKANFFKNDTLNVFEEVFRIVNSNFFN